MNQFLDDMAFIFANLKVGLGMLLVSAVCFTLHALQSDVTYKGAPMDLIGTATAALGIMICIAAGIRHLRKSD